MKVKEVIKLVENHGWVLKRMKGSHRQYKHNVKEGLVTIPGNLNEDLAIGTLKNIFKQAGIKHE